MKNILLKTALTVMLCGTASISGSAQTAVGTNAGKQSPPKIIAAAPPIFSFDKSENEAGTTEKAIETDAKVNVYACVAGGEVIVRGWQRGEVRVLISKGVVKYKVSQRSGETNKPEVLYINDAAGKESAAENFDGCLNAELITLEVPYGASVFIKSGSRTKHEGDWSFDSLAKVTVDNVNGNILLRNIKQEIAATSLQGNVAAEDSSGKIALRTVGGNIAAFRLRPNEFSDTLKISSASGGVVLRDVTHKNIEAKSVSGELGIFGSLVRGGNYDFNTLSGSVVLQLPADFPFQIRATMTAGGNFQNDFPLKFSTVKIPGQARLLTGANGTGDTVINLTTFNGLIHLAKK